MKARSEHGYSNFRQIRIGGDYADAGNGIDIKPALASASPTIEAVGDDTNVDITLVPKGTGRLKTTEGVGAAAGGATVVATEYGSGLVHQTVLTLTATPITVTDALAYAGLKVYDFPAGRILILGSTASLAFAVTSARASTINDNAAMDWAIGSATASNVTLATTMVDLLPKVDKTLDGAVAAYTTASTGALAASAQFDGTSTALDAFLNVSFPTTTDIDADGTLAVQGTITLSWINLGDY